MHRRRCPAAAPRWVPSQRQQRLPSVLAVARRARRRQPDQLRAIHAGFAVCGWVRERSHTNCGCSELGTERWARVLEQDNVVEIWPAF
uniref:Uncharacterized protein n=1 Tax=Arundo donax TaxID=35708 RepID=A0A0A9D677_ARUDO